MKIQLLTLVLLFAASALAGDLKVTAELATRTAQIGDAVSLTVRITHDPADPVVQETLPEQLDQATVLDQQWTPATTEEKGPKHTEMVVKLAWYNHGEFKVPPIKVKLQSGAEIDTPQLSLEIIKLLDEDDKEVAPLKGQLGLSWAQLLLIGAAALLLLLLLIGGLIYWLARRKKPEAKVVVPPKPPYDEAIDALNALNAGSLLKEGRVKEFHVAINLIIRRYYGRLFSIGAEEMTSLELETWFDNHGNRLPGDLIALNHGFQEQCDRVKFAKHDPVEAENKETINRAYQIVAALKPMAQVTSEVPNVAHG